MAPYSCHGPRKRAAQRAGVRALMNMPHPVVTADHAISVNPDRGGFSSARMRACWVAFPQTRDRFAPATTKGGADLQPRRHSHKYRFERIAGA